MDVKRQPYFCDIDAIASCLRLSYACVLAQTQHSPLGILVLHAIEL